MLLALGENGFAIVAETIRCPITSYGFSDNYSIGEANQQLMQLAAYGKLAFDIEQPFSENTVFEIVEN